MHANPASISLVDPKKTRDRIMAECNTINPDGVFTFIKADVSLICIVDDVCHVIKAKEKSINLLFLITGIMVFHTSNPS
jgi:hypothetical protein